MTTEIAGRKVLITGGHGFLGPYLQRRFREEGAVVSAPPRTECDFTRREQVERLFADLRPDIVVHAAGFVGGIHFSRLYPADVFLRNLQMACHVIEMAHAFQVAKLVNIGSACVYSDQLEAPFREADMLARPMHPSVQLYGFSKQALYFGGLAFRQQYGLNSIHLIPANLYGPGDKFDPELSHVVSSMIPKFFQAARKGTPQVVCWGTGRTVREFLYVADCAEAIVRATRIYDEPEPLNLGFGDGITMRELASLIAKATGFGGEIAWDASKPDGALYKVIDSSRARAVLGWVPAMSFEQGLRETVNWFAARYAAWSAARETVRTDQDKSA
jgi:GDP-L-fucose synthase